MASAYTTPGYVEDELRTTTNFSNNTNPSLASVNRWIQEASAWIDRYTGYTASSHTVSSEVMDYDGDDRFLTREAPIDTVNELLYNPEPINSAAAWTELTEDVHFYINKKRGEVFPIFSKWTPKFGPKRVLLSYDVGGDTPLEYQQLATKMVALRVLESLIHQNVNEGNDGGAISVGSISIVEPASYGVNSYNQLRNEVIEGKKELKTSSGVYRY